MPPTPAGGPDVWAVVVAAGSGSRFGAPKQFAVLAGRPVVERSVEAARSVAAGVVVVVPPDRLGTAFGADLVVGGGPTRSASVRRGLAAVPPSAGVVVVHDAARPLAAPDLFASVVAAVVEEGCAAAICAVPLADTVKRVDEHRRVTETLDRNGLVAVQTPQAFDAQVLRRAHAGGGDATDDAALVEALGATVVVVEGSLDNLKITTPADLAYAERLLST